jgi:hypothetical protein
MGESFVRNERLEMVTRTAVTVLHLIAPIVGTADLRVRLAGLVRGSFHDQEFLFAGFDVAQQLEQEIFRWIIPGLA